MTSYVKIEDATDHHVDGADLYPEAGNMDAGVDSTPRRAPGEGPVLVKIEENPRDSAGAVPTRSAGAVPMRSAGGVSTRSSVSASGHATRRRWSNQSDARPSPAPRALPSTDRVVPTRKRYKMGCGRDSCGKESAEGVPVCFACHLPPQSSCGRCQWRHFQSDEVAANAAEIWTRETAKPTPLSTVVPQGFRPSKGDCFCDRQTCFVKLVLKWKRKMEAENKRKCAVCCTSRASSWKKPKSSLRLHQRYYSSVHAKCQRLRETGGTLTADSWMCNRCNAESYRKARLVFPGDTSTVERYLNFLELHRPAPSENTESFAEHVTLLYFLKNLKEGELVHLGDGVATMRNAREGAGLASMDEQALLQKVSGMFKELSSCVQDASQFSCSSDRIGEGDSLCLVPSRVNPRYVARLNRSERRLEKEAGNHARREGGAML